MAYGKYRWQTALSAATALGGLLLGSANLHAQEEVADGPTLSVGSKAPALDVEHWVQDGGGKYKPVKEFKPGNVYVVEFWATWCGPCVASMPHLATMQTEYADKGVQVVSISDEDLETVEKFLEREVPDAPGDEGDAEEKKTKTFRELTSAYCLTTDPDRSVSKDYMEAAQENGIPTAFLVGKDGTVEWIGHPMELDEPLKAVVDGSWDREAFKQQLVSRKQAETTLKGVFALLQRQDFDGALVKLDEAMGLNSDSMQLKMLKLQVLIAAGKLEPAEEWAASLFNDLRDKPDAVNMVAWSIYQMAAGGALEKGALIDTAARATEEAVKTGPKELKASALDTLARLQYVSGDLDKSIATQRQAIKLAKPEEREMLQEFLTEVEKAKAQQDEPQKDAAP